MILMNQIFYVIANENACYKRNELECRIKINNNIDFASSCPSNRGVWLDRF